MGSYNRRARKSLPDRIRTAKKHIPDACRNRVDDVLHPHDPKTPLEPRCEDDVLAIARPPLAAADKVDENAIKLLDDLERWDVGGEDVQNLGNGISVDVERSGVVCEPPVPCRIEHRFEPCDEIHVGEFGVAGGVER
ncbi:BQ5605_C007g04830 [Microbotryum silenes-dioicae]|uniref:BQ5605_C007g04830 protein n=1 Tax=Microbotryum silenes-dioicae TaxID=796604 RepID=A0A2X0M845_9BASI|nr:BQ5605_C007g04830 [Microbotryum silenes-dioicae]